jgi:ketosteroid isomerase-like protein
MPSPVIETFMRTLREAEKSRDPGPLAELFTDDAELSTLTRYEPRRGHTGTRQFWAEYLHSFGKVQSQFENVIEADGTAVLEWESDVTLPDGRPVKYRGVSILETGGGRVRRFRTYYDTAALHPGPTVAGAAGRAPPAPDQWAPEAVKPTPAGSGTTSVEQINRETKPRDAQGQLVDPKQEEVRDTAG